MTTKRMVLLGIYAAVFLISMIGLFRATTSQAEYTIKAAIQASTQDEDYVGLIAFKEFVERESNGRVEVAIYPSGQFCASVPECISNLQQGVLEMFPSTAGGTGNFFGPAQVLDIPYLFNGDKQVVCALNGPILDKMRQAVLERSLQLRLLGISNTGGWRNFATTTKPVRHPSDLVGQKIRTTGAQIQQELVRALGANPTPISWAELYTALATGVVEGSKNGIQDIIGAKLEEHLKYIVLDGHSYMATLWWFSEPVWQTLPNDIQQIVINGFVKQQQAANNLVAQQEANSYKIFEQVGGSVHRPTPEQQAAFKSSSSNIRQWYIDNYDEQWLITLEQSIEQCDKAPK